jgi:hypothetical protein
MTMTDTPTPIELDPHWLEEWVTYGFIELYAYLANHAAFAAFLDQKEKQ